MALCMSSAHMIPLLFLHLPNSSFKLKISKSPFHPSVFHYISYIPTKLHKSLFTSFEQILSNYYVLDTGSTKKNDCSPLKRTQQIHVALLQIIYWEKMVSLHVIVLAVCLCPNHTMSKDWVLVTTVYPQAQAQQWHRLGTQKCFSNLPRFLSLDNTGGHLAK